MRDTTTKCKKNVEVIQEDWDWLDEAIPNINKWWLLQKLIEAFRLSYEADAESSIQNRIKIVGKEVKDTVTFDPDKNVA